MSLFTKRAAGETAEPTPVDDALRPYLEQVDVAGISLKLSRNGQFADRTDAEVEALIQAERIKQAETLRRNDEERQRARARDDLHRCPICDEVDYIGGPGSLCSTCRHIGQLIADAELLASPRAENVREWLRHNQQ